MRIKSNAIVRPIMVVAGARPNFMKVVPILRALDARGLPRLFVHTGQHYDLRMSQALLDDLGAPAVDTMLDVGSASHAVQTARVMERFEPILIDAAPSWLVVVGDVNSTLACALVASKLSEKLETRIAHVEAGLRSFDWRMPEEVNRVLTDRMSHLLLTPSRDAHGNLEREGIASERVRFVGNVMIDSLLNVLPRARALGVADRLVGRHRPFVVMTLHRPSNVDDPERLRSLLEAVDLLSRRVGVVFPMHPRTRTRVDELGLSHLLSRVTLTEPLGYAETVALVDASSAVVTDSGGLQEESTVLGVPCVTVREQTERPVTVTEGTNTLVPWPPTTEGVIRSVETAIGGGRSALGTRAPEGWDGAAAERIVDALVSASSSCDHTSQSAV